MDCIVSVSFAPYGLILFPILFLIALRWPRREIEVLENSRVGIIRRYFALNVDVFVGMLAVLPFICMLALFLEFFVTGQWVWSFERETFRSTDIVSVAGIFVGFYGIYYYIKWHFQHGKQTLGQYLLGFQLLPAGENPMLSVRYFVALVNGAWWPTWPWTIFRRKQDYWWDTASQTKVRLVKPT